MSSPNQISKDEQFGSANKKTSPQTNFRIFLNEEESLKANIRKSLCPRHFKLNIAELRLNKNADELRWMLEELWEAFQGAVVEAEQKEKKLNAEMARLRAEMSRLENQLIDAQGRIRVGIRYHDQSDKFHIDDNELVLADGSRSYQFENIFDPSCNQNDVSAQMNELTTAVLSGYNVSIIAYGPTGSGKTYTMRGDKKDPSSSGLIPRTVDHLLRQTYSNENFSDWNFDFCASFVEVYNDDVYDLLDDRKKCKLKMGKDTTTMVDGLKLVPLNSLSDIDKVLAVADKNRSTAATMCNASSSRSHALFEVHVNGYSEISNKRLKSSLTLVDLAGSERARESLAVGQRFTELKHINLSLTTLKKCMRAQLNQGRHVPFRDSKLTMLLKKYLSDGASRTVFIAHLNPKDIIEAKRTLDFTAELRSTCIGRASSNIY